MQFGYGACTRCITLLPTRYCEQEYINRTAGPGYFKDLGTTALSCVQSLIRALRNLKGSTLESLLSFFAKSSST